MLHTKQVMKQIDPKELKAIVIEALEEVRHLAGKSTNATTDAVIDAKIRFFEMLCVFIAKYETEDGYDMEKMRQDLIKETVKLDDILPRRREGVLEPMIQRIAKQLQFEPETAYLIDKDAISWGNLSNYVSRMHKKGTLPKSVRAMKRQEKYYLAWLASEETVSKKK